MTLKDPRESTMSPKPEGPQPPPGLQAEMTVQPDCGEASYKGNGRLKDRVALITGGDSGIGRAVALAYAREGADVAISYMAEEQTDADETSRVVRAAGRRCLTLPGDIRDEAHCNRLVQRTHEEFGRLDILVNNAAFQMTHENITEITAEEFDRVFRTNVYATFYLCKAALPLMQPGACIINTASVEAYQPDYFLLHYASTKGALVAFTKAFAHEAIKRGVRVNAVAPGPIWTPLIPATMSPEKVQAFGKQAPIGRAGQPAELAPIYVLLASDESSYVVGAVYAVTGGMITA